MRTSLWGRVLAAPTLALAIFAFAPSASAQPANDECAGAIQLFDGANLGLSTTGATSSAPLNWCAGTPVLADGLDVWFFYIATCTGNTTVTSCPNTAVPPPSEDSVIQVYSGTCGSLGTPLGCNDDACGVGGGSTVTFASSFGSTYLIRVKNWDAAVAWADGITISCAVPVPGDDCATATPIVQGANAGSNVGATFGAAPNTWCAGGASAGLDVWFSFTSDCVGTGITFSTCPAAGTLVDTVMQVYQGSCSNLTFLNCNDDACGVANGSTVTVNNTFGTTYYVRVKGFAAAGSGTFTLNVTCVSPSEDWGDAPLANAGIARHTSAGASERLGATVTTEAATVLPEWTGDGGDDGIVSVSNLSPGDAAATIVVSATNPLGTFTDFCRLWVRRSAITAGWSTASDGLPTQTGSVGPGVTNFTFGPFTYSATGAPSPYVRVRLSFNTSGVSSSTSTGAFGETEDYVIPGSGGALTTGGDDASDAPLPYPPANSTNISSERLGTSVTADAQAPVGFPAGGAAAWTADTDDGLFRVDGLVPGGSCTLTVQASDPLGTFTDIISAWMDFNNDGDWDDAGERFPHVSQSVGPALVSVTLGPLAVPVGVGPTVPTRVKLHFTSTTTPAHLAAGASLTFGEIEDYNLPPQRGTSCNTTTFVGTPTLFAPDAARVGGPVTLQSRGLAPSLAVFTVFGNFAGSGADLTSLGLSMSPGVCFLYVLPQLLGVFGGSDANGEYALNLNVPNDVALTGQTGHFQNFQFVSPSEVTATNALTFTILP